MGTRSTTRAPETAIVVAPSRELSTELLETERASARKYVGASVADNTRKAYESDAKMFARWCAARGVDALPASPETVATYVAALADGTAHPNEDGTPRPLKASTIARRLASLSVAHKMAKLASPYASELVQRALEGVRRTKGVRPTQKTAVVSDVMRRLLDTLDPDGDDADARSASMLTLGFGGAFRRAEITQLDDDHVEVVPQGLLVLVARSKTDQHGAGATVKVPRAQDPRYCPVVALERWRARRVALGLRAGEGPLFVSLSRHRYLERLDGRAVATAVKDCVTRAGLDPATFAGHSLRRGHVTSAIRAGKRIEAVQTVTRHKHIDTLLGYLDREGGWDDVSGEGLL